MLRLVTVVKALSISAPAYSLVMGSGYVRLEKYMHTRENRTGNVKVTIPCDHFAFQMAAYITRSEDAVLM